MLQRSYERSHEEWIRLFASSGWEIINQSTHNNHAVYTLQKSTSKLPHGSSTTPTTTITTTTTTTTTATATGSTGLHNANSRVSKAVIPIAGLGTRMHPISAVIPKALLPVFFNGENDKDEGKMRVDFALNHLLSQLLSEDTGITQVIQSTLSHLLSTNTSFIPYPLNLVSILI